MPGRWVVTPERRLEVEQADQAAIGLLIRRRPRSAIAHRRELLAHIRDLESVQDRVHAAVARLKHQAEYGAPNSTVSLSVWESALSIEEALGCKVAYEEAR